MSRRRGVVVVVAGTDGSGKTEVARALARALSPPVLHLHHRPGVLPSRTRHEGPVTEPHRNRAYPVWLSVLKVLYLWADFAVGWWMRVRPVLRTGGSVVLERGWWDLAVDPRRYRLAPLPRLVKLASALLPRPDATIVLRAATHTLLERKQELPAEELDRQQAAWGRVPRVRMNAVFIDAGQPFRHVLAEVEASVHTVMRHG